MQGRANKTLNMKNFMVVQFAWHRSDATTPSSFGFSDNTHNNSMNVSGNWRRTFGTRLQGSITYTYSRSATLTTPYFANRQNVSGDAGISGNDQEPVNYGPPTLQFSSGIQGLTDAQASFTRNSTGALGLSGMWMHSPHTIQFGGDFRRQQFNLLSQQDPRGVLTFTSDATGSDFQHFLDGVPDAVSIAYGNADKYLRSNMWDAYIKDDWRVLPGFTLNAGLRWDYGSPITERYGRLVNLDVAPGFTNAVSVIGNNPTGALTRQSYPGSLVRPDRHGFEPSLAIAWHPFAAGSMVVRAGYGLGYNTSVYQSIAMQMAQQSPLSTNLERPEQHGIGPLTLANPFPNRNQLVNTLPTRSASIRIILVGYAQNWQVQAQQDMTASTVMTLTYLGIKGTRGTQVSMPNTYPSGAVNPCPACPSGFKYVTSNGNSTREAGTIALRRRLHNGIAASVQYTYSHSFDDAVMSGQGQLLAQNWLNLSAERGPSSFDQRHLASLTAQYTSGMGLAGGALLRGWKGAAFKGWTLQSTINVGTGLPETPIYFAPVTGTATTGSLRPQATGIAVNMPPAGRSSESRRLPGASTGSVGQCGPQLNHRAFAVFAECLHGALVRPVRSSFRFHKRAESRHLHGLGCHRQQRSIRPARFRQCHAQRASHPEMEILTMRRMKGRGWGPGAWGRGLKLGGRARQGLRSLSRWASSEGAIENSPRRKPWVSAQHEEAPGWGRKNDNPRSRHLRVASPLVARAALVFLLCFMLVAQQATQPPRAATTDATSIGQVPSQFQLGGGSGQRVR